MARGLIRDDDIATVRERAPLEDVVRTLVTLKSSGGGNFKGLCPFHDEKSPSFTVNPSRGFYHCFGCGEGGDAIKFLQETNGMSFVDAVEHLASLIGLELRFTDEDSGDIANRQAEQGRRARLVEANAAAQAFYAQNLLDSPEAHIARRFLADRLFRRDAALLFGCGYSIDSWDSLTSHLSSLGFTTAELIESGLSLEGKRGPVDRFRGRVMWPIRDTNGTVVGFGARRLHDTDDGPKYLNTPETTLYKKSKVLFGLDLARKTIASTKRVVIVEGYTDVMAMYLAGETTAVATCGTAFGEDHIRVLRRLLGDDSAFTGEIIYCFDGDKAGQNAALKSFELDDRFQTRTYVAADPTGMDPCEVRIAHGDTGVADLVTSRVPLFEFAIRTALATQNLSTPEGRVNALTATAPIVAAIREKSLRPEYVRRLARWLRFSEDTVAEAVRTIRPGSVNPHEQSTIKAVPESDSTLPHPDAHKPELLNERETLRLLIQSPDAAIRHAQIISHTDYSNPTYRALASITLEFITSHHPEPGRAFIAALNSALTEPALVNLVAELATTPPPRFESSKWHPRLTIDEDDLTRRVFQRLAAESLQRQIVEATGRSNDPSLNEADVVAATTAMLDLITRKRALSTSSLI